MEHNNPYAVPGGKGVAGGIHVTVCQILRAHGDPFTGGMDSQAAACTRPLITVLDNR